MKNYLIIIISIIISNKVLAQDSLHLVATITGEQIGDEFGNVAGLGDVNGDGFDDFIVSAKEYVKIFFGGVSFDTIADFRFNNSDTLVMSSKVAGAGDVNNDGFNDVLLGGFYKNGLYPKSIVFLYFGGTNMDTIPDFQFIPPYGIQDMLGQISQAGDVNNDGYDDFIVGVPYNWYDGIGRVYLFLGGDIIANQPFLTFKSDGLEDFFGRAVTSISDVNGDNFDDIMIGKPNDLTIGDTSYIYIYMGSSYMDNVHDYIFTGTADYPIGSILSKAGDVNGDSLSDIFFCYPTKLYFGDSNLNFSQPIVFSSDEENDNFGYSLSNSGDINNDGYSDILIGALNNKNNNNIMVGKIYCYLGSNDMDTITDYSMEGETLWSQYSKYLCIAGDINNDGYDEVMVGAPNFPDHANPLGKIYIYSYTDINSVEDNNVEHNISTFKLYSNYPNPFNSSTNIVYVIFNTSEIELEIYNYLGQLIKVVKKGIQNAGKYSYVWDGTNEEKNQVSSGIYFIRLFVKSHSLSQKRSALQKVVLIK